MSEVERIVDQLQRAFEGEAWHGPSVLEIIEGIEGMSSVYVTLHGIVQHDLYHAGQIAILKKAASEGARNERTSK